MADTAWAEELVGETLVDRYTLDGVLGSGGMGVVFAATHLRLGRPVAIKMIHPIYTRDRRIADRFHQEAQAAASVGSRGVVEVLDLDEDPRHGAFLVMERLRGESYVDLLRQGRIPVQRAVWIVTELLDVLAAVHAKGIVHRDLKPPNVFIHQDESGDELVKVLDFGVAKVQRRHLTMTGQLIGTPRFMAPEQARGEDLDHRCDIYAAGLLLYCGLTGLPPYASIPDARVIESVVAGPPSLRTLRGDLPTALIDAVDTALSVDPEARFQSASAMAAAVRQAVGDTLVDAEPLGSDQARATPLGYSVPHETEDDKKDSPVEDRDIAQENVAPNRAEETGTTTAATTTAVDKGAHPTEDAAPEDLPPAAFQDESSIVVPQHHAWKGVVLLLVVALGVAITLLLRTPPIPTVQADLNVTGDCLIPTGVLEVEATAEGMRFTSAAPNAPRLEIQTRGNRYWVATGTSASGASAEVLSGTGPGRLRVLAMERPEQIHLVFHRVSLLTARGSCVVEGEIESVSAP